MNLQFYFEKLLNSEEFKNFKDQNPNAYLCSGFIAIDKNGNDNQQHFDYSINQKIFSFQVEKNCQKIPIENATNQKFEKIPDNVNFDFQKLENLIQEKMQQEKINNKIQKYLLSLQRKNKTNYLIGTIFISRMGMIKTKINLDTMKIEDFEKTSFLDMIKVIKK